jgi:flagellar protein FliO/FliZ
MRQLFRLGLLTVCLLLSFFATSVVSAETVQTNAGNPVSLSMQEGNGTTGNIGGMSVVEMMLRVIVSLIIIIVIFVIIMKVLSQKNQKWFSGRAMRTLGGVTLGQNKSLQVVEIGERVYVVGVGEDISLIDKIDDPKAIDALHASLASEQHRPPISEWFQRLRSKQNEPEPEDITASFQEVFHRKMQDLPSRKKWVESMLQDEQPESGRKKHE